MGSTTSSKIYGFFFLMRLCQRFEIVVLLLLCVVGVVVDVVLLLLLCCVVVIDLGFVSQGSKEI